MSLVIHAQAMKGAASRTLRARVDEEVARVGDLLTAEQQAALKALVGAANKLIVRMPAGKLVDIQLLLADAPFGGCDATVSVTASRPPSR